MKGETPFPPPQSRWFRPILPTEDMTELEYRDRRLRAIWNNSRRCTREMDHEAGWNGAVHGLIMAEALEDMSSTVGLRNITSTRTNPVFLDKDKGLGENRVDFGLFLTGLSPFTAGLPEDFPLLHLDLPDGARTPLAVSVETESLSAREADGPTQLANWVRAHFRQLDDAAARRRRQDGNVRDLPVLPLVFVFGNRWMVSFAGRRNGSTVCCLCSRRSAG